MTYAIKQYLNRPEQDKKIGKSKMTTFQDLKKGNENQIGTREIIRASVMKPILEANERQIAMDVRGVNLNLLANESLSKKSRTYVTGLSIEQYVLINGSDFGIKKDAQKYAPSISLSSNGIVTLYSGGLYHIEIPNDQITIL